MNFLISHLIKLILTFTLVSYFGISVANAAGQKNNNPNVLLIMVDDLNDWIGVMNGHPNAITPNMDRLANKGTLFTNAHAAVPLCGPTRTALLTGLRPSTTGLYGQPHYSDIKNNPRAGSVKLLTEYFSEHGYKTMSTGKVFHRGSPKEAFDVVGEERRDFGPYPDERMNWTPPEGHNTSTDWGPFPAKDEMMPDYQYAQWAAEQLQKNHEQPFFMSVGFVRPHVPLHVPQKWFDMHPLEDIMLPPQKDDQFDDMPETAIRFSYQVRMPNMDFMREGERWRESVQAYLACVTFVDHYIGVVLEALEKSSHADNTIVVLMSDHGYHVGEKGMWSKHTLWEESTRIPLIITRPDDIGTQSASNRSHKPVNHIDIYPTLLDLAGLPPNPDNEGTSLVPLMDDPDADGFESSLTTHGYGNHSIRTERWRYTQYEDGAEEFYDHWTDPNEWSNLASKAQYSAIIQELRKRLPAKNALWDASVQRGSHYNQYLQDLFDKYRNDR